jgi:Secretion system C-terminal sorting domain
MKNLFTFFLVSCLFSQAVAQNTEVTASASTVTVTRGGAGATVTITAKFFGQITLTSPALTIFSYIDHTPDAWSVTTGAGGTLTGATTALAGTTTGGKNTLTLNIPNTATLGEVFTVSYTAHSNNGDGVNATQKTGTVTVTVSTVLAVELTSFEAKAEGNKVNLAWSTASEKENDFFAVERSNDGVNFTTVGTVKGHGTSNEMNSYTFTDATATGSVVYYRLKDNDFSGQSNTSKVISVNLGKGSKLEIGVIATDLGLVTFNAMEAGDATLNVVNLSGQVVAQAQTVATEGNNAVKMNLNELANGIYILQVLTANSTVTKKFAKN